uniref:Uncharacterized protein n=1 Tax=Anguilla anguilla TaxID=7936 RepID=A0A0E9TXK5_ANGAN
MFMFSTSQAFNMGMDRPPNPKKQEYLLQIREHSTGKQIFLKGKGTQKTYTIEFCMFFYCAIIIKYF